MKTMIAFLAGLALAGAAVAEVNPTRPMLTGRGNVAVSRGQVIVTNQTASAADDTIKLDNLVVTGSLLGVNPARPMVTGRGNVAVSPGQVIVTNQTASGADDTIKLDNLVVTGSLLPH
jgi:ribosomal protein L21